MARTNDNRCYNSIDLYFQLIGEQKVRINVNIAQYKQHSTVKMLRQFFLPGISVIAENYNDENGRIDCDES